MQKKKELIISIVAIVVLVLAIVGVSFAAFNYSRTGSTVNTITTGAISMTYTETSNVINIDGALPTTDATGMVRLKEGEYFDFSISSTIQGTVNINYEISAKDITVLEGDEQKIDGSHIKLYLTKLNGSEEEALMSPKTYKEETSVNDYTGRPSGEMSLYQSNMTSSETNNYRLRMYVDENYNPQGDGGGLVFAVQVNVYGKSGDKYEPVATEILLAKANAEDLDYNSATEAEQKEMWTFSHAATEQTEALTDYRYIGADPNNYVTFNNEMWRIIGVFTVDDGTGNKEERLKIIKDDSLGLIAWANNNQNNWPSTLANNLNSGDYWTNSLGEEAKEMIGDTLWYLGGVDSSYDTAVASTFYDSERGMTVYSGRNTSWVGKVGLIYSSDYGYATSGGITTDRNMCLNKEIYNWDTSEDYSDCPTNDWLFQIGWTMTSNANSYGGVFYTEGEGSLVPTSAYYTNQVHPVVFLKSNIKIVNGDGSSSDPYILEA